MKKFLLSLGFSLLLVGCDKPSHQTELFAFGTKITVSFEKVSASKARELSQAIEQQFNAMNHQWHAWQPSTLTAINAICKNGKTYEADATVIELLQYGKTLHAQSSGLFNPAAGELIALWGFLSNTPTLTRKAPNDSAIQAWLQQTPSMADITLQGSTVSCHNPSVRLDFGGFAKGYGINAIINYLQQQGVEHAMVNAGGDLVAIGARGDRPWRVALQHPDNPQQALAVIDVHHQEGVFSSGTYYRKFSDGEKTYHHILDPRSGYPANGFISATVIHTDATVADAAATSLLIAGPADWQRIAHQMQIENVLLVEADGTVHVTPSMLKHIEWATKPSKVIVHQSYQT